MSSFRAIANAGSIGMKSKTKSGIRTVPLNNFFNIFMNDILKDKKDNDFLFFKDEQKENRNDILQKRISRNIRKYIKNENASNIVQMPKHMLRIVSNRY